VILCGLVVTMLLPGVASADVGIKGPTYTTGTGGSPTTSKPESKLWFNDGYWWAVMAKKVTYDGTNDYHIFRLRLRPQTWVDTGVVVDGRDSTRQDVLWTGSKLFIASHKYVVTSNFDSTPAIADQMRLYRFNYNAGSNTYTLDGTAVIDAQKSETLVIDRDGTGAIWATWVQEDSGGSQHHVYVNKSDGNCVGGVMSQCNFSSPPHSLDNVGADDISSVIRFGSNVGVMWSNTSAGVGQMRFNSHADGQPLNTWSGEEGVLGGSTEPKLADDHINLKADSSGRVYAVTKTKYVGQTRPGTVLSRRRTDGTWSSKIVTRASLGHTRPIVILDQGHNAIRVFEGPTSGGPIYMKRSRLNVISFPQFSHGATVMRDTGSSVANPTSTKQNVSNGTRLIVLATNSSTKRYWHAYLQIIPCIRGTSGSNVLVGTRGNDALCGLGGNDTLKGLGGNDRLVGGGGNDRFYARDGFRDVLLGGTGFDRARVNASDVRRSIEALF
jgi:Ca2+-binding RTX toxin-like protein